MADEQETSSDPWAAWRGRMSASRKRRDERIGTWQENVDARKGQTNRGGDVARLTTTSSTVCINQDWPLTKAKIAQLYSQTPEVRLTPRLEGFEQAVPIFGRELNDTISDVGVGGTIEEVLSDVVNAAGIGGVLVSCEIRTEQKEVPTVDPAMLPPEMQAGVMSGAVQLPTTTVDNPVDIRYLVQRISPADLLVPDDFTGSNYDQARWLGEDGRMTWSQAVANLGLTDEEKEKVLGKDRRASTGLNSLNTDTNTFRDTDVVNYTQLFYWRHFYHAEETSFKALQRLVFVEGLDEPKVNEPYSAQQRGEDGQIVGVTENPIRVCTLTYISDDSLPPSDSTIVRPQIQELQDSRADMQLQRKHSIPIRWFDSNRVSTGTRSLLEKGTFQGFIPTNGPGDRAVGEVARASFPPEKYEIDRIIKDEISETVQVGTNQAGAFASGERSASEAKIVEGNFQRRVGQEQDKVTKFFVGIVRVLAGHMAIYGTFKLPDELGQNRQLLANAFTYSVRADSTVRLDAQQRIDQLKEFFNLWFQTGYINPKPIAEEWAGLAGLDPAKVVVDPSPKPPEPVKLSVSNAVDLRDPVFLAALSRTHQLPLPDDVSAVDKFLQALAAIGLGVAPMAPQGKPADPNAPPGEIQQPHVFNADMGTAPRVERRAEDGGA